MYYSFYMNERMLIDEWKYYQRKGECNWLLKRTLMNDNSRTAEQKKQFYFENRRVVNKYSDFFKEQAELVKEYCLDMEGRFETDEEMEYFLDHKYINDDYEVMDYGHNQKLFNMYRRYNDLVDNANEKVIAHLSFNPIKGAKFREHKSICLYRSDIKYVRYHRKYHDLTIPQIEILFGIIFFCRMHESKEAKLDTPFKMKQFLGCFDNATMEDFEYVVSIAFNKTEDGDVVYKDYYNWEIKNENGEWIGSEDSIWVDVTRANNKLNLTKMAHKYITDISDKRYCAMCLKPFKPTNNRQQVCEECKPVADAVKTKLRKTKQRFIQKHGKDACCGKCTDCIRTDCKNWWEYWFDELDNRWLDYMIKNNYSYPRSVDKLSQEEKDKVLEQLLHDIKNVYTKEEKSEIIPWEMKYKFKRYSPYA